MTTSTILKIIKGSKLLKEDGINAFTSVGSEIGFEIAMSILIAQLSEKNKAEDVLMILMDHGII
jgi:hypothetical protein